VTFASVKEAEAMFSKLNNSILEHIEVEGEVLFINYAKPKECKARMCTIWRKAFEATICSNFMYLELVYTTYAIVSTKYGQIFNPS